MDAWPMMPSAPLAQPERQSLVPRLLARHEPCNIEPILPHLQALCWMDTQRQPYAP